ncbi:MAG TPA: hypothetical protein VG841_05790 [Caulobacterales bacterium]|nr:hypothetical protein [Caulobacterales bacterium]
MKDGHLLWRPSEGWTIGVDFGTAFSKAAAVLVDGRAGGRFHKIYPLHIGGVSGASRSLMVPSAMFITGGRIHLGPRAIEHYHLLGDPRREMLQSFKMVLGAYDFEDALDWRLQRTIDPEAEFRRGDLIAIYLAYLLELIEHAAPSEMGSVFGADATTKLRYSRPAWLPNRAAAAYAAMEKLFQTAWSIRRELGHELLAPDGLGTVRAHDVLSRAVVDETPFANLDGAIYEAGAVAACHFVDPKTPDCLVVADIGAGTTDFAGFIRHGEGEEIEVVDNTQKTILVAGDIFDRALMNLLLRKGMRFDTIKSRDAAWRVMAANIRDLKEELIATGRVRFRLDKSKVLKCRISEFVDCEDYSEAAQLIEETFEACVAETARRIKSRKLRRMSIVFAGGGVHLPSTVQMVKNLRRKVRGVKVRLAPSVPKWANDLHSERDFATLFSQMSVAFGTAMSVPNQVRPRSPVSEAV